MSGAENSRLPLGSDRAAACESAAPKLSVVTVCLNAAATIRHTLESFCRQTHPAKEMLIVDGGSRDGTIEIAERFAGAGVRVVGARVTGIYAAMNRGLDEYAGDAVGFLNADDTFHDARALERIAGALHQSDIAYGDLVMVENHDTKRSVRSWTSGALDRRALAQGWMPPHPSFYVRRKVVEAVGRFDPRYGLASDYDFMLRVLRDDRLTATYIPHTLVDFMVGGRSTRGLGAVIRGNWACARARHAHLGTPVLGAALLLKPLSKIGQIRWR